MSGARLAAVVGERAQAGGLPDLQGFSDQIEAGFILKFLHSRAFRGEPFPGTALTVVLFDVFRGQSKELDRHRLVAAVAIRLEVPDVQEDPATRKSKQSSELSASGTHRSQSLGYRLFT